MMNLVRPQDEKTEFTSIRDYVGWLASLPTLHSQGDGMRSFTGTLISLLVHPTSIILLDEPEAFLHPPQARRLAEIIASEVPGNCQVIVATHNDAFIRALLDASEKRVILARIVRSGDRNNASVLDQTKLLEMWSDSLLRTSDVLSALFHEAALLCEGDSDARFFSALLDATRGERRDPDVGFYHFGGKDRIASMARALRAVQIPVVAIVDIDILSEKEKFLMLFEALGGKKHLVEQDVADLNRFVGQRKGQLTGNELSVELRRIAKDCESEPNISNSTKNKLQDLIKPASNWARVKIDGKRALDAPTFDRISRLGKEVGLLINPEGELEGLCRMISRSRKSEWLVEVIKRDFKADAVLADARDFAGEIRTVVANVISQAPSAQARST
jgi:AAA domain, putative AbiEii toxin, Type IV TA system